MQGRREKNMYSDTRYDIIRREREKRRKSTYPAKRLGNTEYKRKKYILTKR